MEKIWVTREEAEKMFPLKHECPQCDEIITDDEINSFIDSSKHLDIK